VVSISATKRSAPTHCRALRLEHLERHGSVVPLVLGQVDRGHPSFTDLPLDPVPTLEGPVQAGLAIAHGWLPCWSARVRGKISARTAPRPSIPPRALGLHHEPLGHERQLPARHAPEAASASFRALSSSMSWLAEVKNSAAVRPADLRGLRAFRDDYPEWHALLLYRGSRRTRNGDVLCIARRGVPRSSRAERISGLTIQVSNGPPDRSTLVRPLQRPVIATSLRDGDPKLAGGEASDTAHQSLFGCPIRWRL